MLLTLTNAERCEVPALEPVESFDTWSSLGANSSVLDEVEIDFQVHRIWTLRRETAALRPPRPLALRADHLSSCGLDDLQSGIYEYLLGRLEVFRLCKGHAR